MATAFADEVKDMTSVITKETALALWKTVPYLEQIKLWPKTGKHILAQYDDKHIYLYQAFCPEIAKFAIEHQKFGGEQYSFTRMSWVKTNFLWMMHRCGWGIKKNQGKVLAIQIPRFCFELILKQACTPHAQKKGGISQDNLQVRLQWDPDHSPIGDSCERRAIQLGLKGEIMRKFATEWVTKIVDVTDFVKSMRNYALDRSQWDKLYSAEERVYPISDANIIELLGLDYHPTED